MIMRRDQATSPKEVTPAKPPKDAKPRRRFHATPAFRLALYFVAALALSWVAVKTGLDRTVATVNSAADGAAGAFLSVGGGKAQYLAENLPSGTSIYQAIRDMLIAVVTAVVFAIPLSGTYTLTKRKEGYDRAIVQMFIILPVVVSIVVLVVRSSLALAFIVSGIAAVVRFRSTFRDVRDAVFGFAALAIGLAAGVHSIAIAGGLSLIFCALTLGLWKLDVGDIRRDQSRIEGDVKLSDVLVPVGNGEAMVRGRAEATLDGSTQKLSEEAARLERIITSDAESHKKKSRFTHLLLVHTNKSKPTRESVEDLLETSAKRWRFVSEVPYNNGTRTLEFLARLRPSANESKLLGSIQKAQEVVGVELKAVGALSETVKSS
jgi:hypothetical protein